MNIETQIENLLVLAEDQKSFAGAKIASAVFYKGVPVSFGFNQPKTHPFALKYARKDGAIYWHAESDAIYKAKKRLSTFEMKRSTIVTVRVKYDFKKRPMIGISKPCAGCMRCIEDAEIGRVVYTEDSPKNLMKYSVVRRK
jgi:tRNA(Arg) A34 adenosine deaminase TadA